MWPSVYAESWESLSIFPRVSWKQLPESQQLLKHHGPWKRPWSASWDRSPACGFLHHNRGTGCFQDTSCACHWSTCCCWPAWKRGSPAEYWAVSWEQETEMISRRSWQMRPLEMCLPYFGRLWQDQRQKLSLASENKTQKPLFPPALHGGIYSHIPSSSNQQSLPKHTCFGMRWIFLVPGQRYGPRSDWEALGNNDGRAHYSLNLVERHSI